MNIAITITTVPLSPSVGLCGAHTDTALPGMVWWQWKCSRKDINMLLWNPLICGDGRFPYKLVKYLNLAPLPDRGHSSYGSKLWLCQNAVHDAVNIDDCLWNSVSLIFDAGQQLLPDHWPRHQADHQWRHEHTEQQHLYRPASLGASLYTPQRRCVTCSNRSRFHMYPQSFAFTRL